MNSFIPHLGHFTNNSNIFSSKLKLKGKIRLEGITIMQAFLHKEIMIWRKMRILEALPPCKNASLSGKQQSILFVTTFLN